MKKSLLILLFLSPYIINGQDLVYTQTFGSPLYINPAFAGNLSKTSFYLNARQQWPSIDGSYSSSSFTANHRLDKINSGIGFIIKQDEEGSARLTSTNVSGIYSYIMHINKKWTISPALQLSYINSHFDESSFIFGDQINDDFSVSNTINENLSFKSSNIIDISTGFIAYNKNTWIGFSTHHLTNPKNFIGNSSSLQRKYSFQTGYEYTFKLNSLREKIIFNPSLNLNFQNPYTRFGINLTTSYHYFTIGSGVANLTSSFSDQNVLNSFFLFGYSDEHFKVGYSYDFTIRGAVGLGGAHEISLGILLNYNNNSNRNSLKRKKIRKVSCPKF